MFQKGLNVCLSLIRNILSNLGNFQLTHIVESSDWAVKNVGESLTSSLNQQRLLRSRYSFSVLGLRNQIVHFDSVNTFLSKGQVHRPHTSNKIILTWFHVAPGDERLDQIKDIQEEIQWIHTSCQATKKQLIEGGIREDKIIIIPLGVNTNIFTPVTQEKKRAVRERLGISQDCFVIGSFQKDGVGWGDGMEPKQIKGPDIFIETVSKLKHLHPFIFLTGPARGYVKHGLEKQGIEYKHTYLKKFSDIPDAYHALDLYLITSRVEGGPLSVLESWASGVPVVSTRVGMVPDIAVSEQTILLSDIGDTSSLSQHVIRLTQDTILRQKIISNALKEVEKYSWKEIAKQYYQKLYRELL